MLRLLLALLSLGGVTARPQNPFESLSLGAMSLAGNIAEAVQSGAALSRTMDIDNPLMSMHSKTAVGYGDAMRPPSASDSSEEDRRRRRRRRRSLPSLLRRSKREPCFWKMGMATTAATGDDEVEARRRARKRAAANNASRSRVSPKTSGKKKLHRRRRQAMPPSSMPPQGSDSALGLGDRIKGMWFAFVDNVTDVVQQMRQKISESASAASSAG